VDDLVVWLASLDLDARKRAGTKELEVHVNGKAYTVLEGRHFSW